MEPSCHFIYLSVTPLVYKQRTLLKVFEPDFVRTLLWVRVIGVEPHFQQFVLAALRLTDFIRGRKPGQIQQTDLLSPQP